MITPEAINFMATHGRGLICLAMTGERLDQLTLAPMAPDNTALGGRAFTVSIDAKGHGVTTGISAHDRARTIRAAIDASSYPEDCARPGHVSRCAPALAASWSAGARRRQRSILLVSRDYTRWRDLRDCQRPWHHGTRA